MKIVEILVGYEKSMQDKRIWRKEGGGNEFFLLYNTQTLGQEAFLTPKTQTTQRPYRVIHTC